MRVLAIIRPILSLKRIWSICDEDNEINKERITVKFKLNLPLNTVPKDKQGSLDKTCQENLLFFGFVFLRAWYFKHGHSLLELTIEVKREARSSTNILIELGSQGVAIDSVIILGQADQYGELFQEVESERVVRLPATIRIR